jgi:hypothetical protein
MKLTIEVEVDYNVQWNEDNTETNGIVSISIDSINKAINDAAIKSSAPMTTGKLLVNFKK